MRVMAGLVPAISTPCLRQCQCKEVDARHKAEHDGLNLILSLHEKKCCGSSGPPIEARTDYAGIDANRLALDIGVPSGRITDILNGRRSITADTAVASGAISGTAHSSGSIYKASSI